MNSACLRDGNYPTIYIVGYIGGIYGIYGIYRSTDQAATCTRINDDQHQFGSLNSITGDPRVYGHVYVASANQGILYADPLPPVR